MKLYYSPNYVGAGHSFDTTRKARWIADSLAATPILGIELVEPEPVTSTQLLALHDADYVNAVRSGEPRTLAESQRFAWDAGLWPMVLSSNGGAVAAALQALQGGVSGSLSSGLHHARRERGEGYCTFNGLVLAAREALAAGAQSVLILDLDAHCGGGTASLIGDEPRIWQVDLSVDSADSYDSSERVWLRMVDHAQSYLAELESALQRIERIGPKFSLCLYNAGMDPYEHCPTGGLAGISRELLAAREAMVFDWCQRRAIPVAFVLAGGYTGPDLDQAGLVELHRLTLAAAHSRSLASRPE